MKVVRQKSTGLLVHGESPDFLPGNGIKSATILTRIPVEDLEETTVTETEWKQANERPQRLPVRELLEKILEVAQEGRPGRKKTIADLEAGT